MAGRGVEKVRAILARAARALTVSMDDRLARAAKKASISRNTDRSMVIIPPGLLGGGAPSCSGMS